ncbi:ATP-binding protein [Streptomyces cacaoi]|uniref:ATP-binding protein n=1 Tax=Streptomyces cacaoi TaxID=1898 RepID=UPI00260E528C|nr:ATP-binding protein [Streptomyces cacaoi]
MAEAQITRYKQQVVVDQWTLVRVRRLVRTHMYWWGFAPLAEDVAQCVHELLINVPKHTGSSWCTLSLERPRRTHVRITVSDTSREPAAIREPDEHGGRGLLLVHGLADAWGVTPTSTGKDVWFEMRVAPLREAA